jgi:hypothetical protein
MDDQTESDEKILAFDVPDEALERANIHFGILHSPLVSLPVATITFSAITPAAWRWSLRSAASHSA